jgi:hypothetical protein
MAFIVTATSNKGAERFPAETATQALEKMLELEAAGWQRITVMGNLRRTLTRDALALLAFPLETAATP